MEMPKPALFINCEKVKRRHKTTGESIGMDFMSVVKDSF